MAWCCCRGGLYVRPLARKDEFVRGPFGVRNYIKSFPTCATAPWNGFLLLECFLYLFFLCLGIFSKASAFYNWQNFLLLFILFIQRSDFFFFLFFHHSHLRTILILWETVIIVPRMKMMCAQMLDNKKKKTATLIKSLTPGPSPTGEGSGMFARS